MRQQLLPINLNIEMLFDNWQQTKNTQAVLNSLKQHTTPQVVYLYGAIGLGKTHLLQSVVHQALNDEKKTIYLDLNKPTPANIWQKLDSLEVICLDNIDNLNEEHQYFLFELYNKVKINHLRLILSAKVAPNYLNYALVDLKTRLNLSLIFSLTNYEDADLKIILVAKIKEQKLLINDNIFDYLLNTFDRDLSLLLTVIEKIKDHVMENKQKVSLPLVKKIMTLV